LRNTSNPMQGTPEHDIVVDLTESEMRSKSLGLSTVDNLLVVHSLDTACSSVYDIRHKEKGAVVSICGPAQGAQVDGTYTPGWGGTHVGSAIIMDATTGVVRQLRIDMDVILQKLLRPEAPCDLPTVMKLLLRRSLCRPQVVRMLQEALRAKSSCSEIAQVFSVLNTAYRQTIEIATQKFPLGRQATVSLSALESVIGDQSILSEKNMVSQVFYPHFLEVTGQDAACLNRNRSTDAKAQDEWRIPLPTEVEIDRSNSLPERSPYIVSVAISYLRSLLGMQILPHKILQCLVFDFCMFFRQEHTLQQLLHYHVLVSSPELVHRLKEVSLRRQSSWTTQACLDMALHLHEYIVVADLLLHTKQYLDVVPFLINHQVKAFRVKTLLEHIEADEQAREQDPNLHDHVLTELRLWRQESAASNTLVCPDFEGCDVWLPEILTC